MESSSALQKELIAHFSTFLANCLGGGEIPKGVNYTLLELS